MITVFSLSNHAIFHLPFCLIYLTLFFDFVECFCSIVYSMPMLLHQKVLFFSFLRPFKQSHSFGRNKILRKPIVYHFKTAESDKLCDIYSSSDRLKKTRVAMSRCARNCCIIHNNPENRKRTLFTHSHRQYSIHICMVYSQDNWKSNQLLNTAVNS